MNLIANSGIQLFTVPIEFDTNDNFKMYFHEWYDVSNQQLKLELAHHFSDQDIWVKKWDLTLLGYATYKDDFNVTESWETIIRDFESDGKKPIPIPTGDPKDSGCFHESLNRLNWDKLENTWFPMPFFQLRNSKSEFGPINWCRFKLIPVNTNGKIRKYNLLLAFDTKSDFQDGALYERPVFSNFERSKDFALCNDDYKLISYCSSDNNCDWVDNYLLKHFHGHDNISAVTGKPKFAYLAQFIYLIKYIQKLKVTPEVTLFSNINVAYGNVDLVVDIGNSRTCAVLFDNSDFTKTSPLELQDFTNLVSNGKLLKYKDPFDMRLAFREADFGGKFGIANSRQFIFPSMIRLGKEANLLIHKATNMNTGAEKTSTFSSPKRFLWDSKPQKQEWEFVQLEGEASKHIYIEGLSEQLNSDGSLNTVGNGGVLMHYSRKALMTFAFLEILSQAQMQINSYEQREHWGNVSMPRKIKRIIVTCPTAMSRTEQVALRKCAEDAAIILKRFSENTFLVKIDENKARTETQVIPSAKKLTAKDQPSEWIYDEATAAQFVFLYAEIGERYLKNAREYFDFYGKIRRELENYNEKSLTVGSVDIGAGTTDVMIATYKYDDNFGACKLTPVPLFWESFYIAGDDLMKELILQLVVDGEYSPIRAKLKADNKKPIDYLQPFLGTDVGVSFRNKQLRSDFNLQVSVPIASYFLELLKQNKVESAVLTYTDIFDNNPPGRKVLDHFSKHFGFDLESLQWRYEKKIVAAIIEKKFDALIGKISSLLSHFDCDIVLLSGRPTSLKPLTDLFLKYYAISPNRLKTMNDYRVGSWYPEDKRYKFVDATGMFINPKSIITTGAIIAHLAENGGLNGFSLNLDELKRNLLPKTNYFGKLNDQLNYIQTFISPMNNLSTINITSLPFRIGVRQLDISSYPSRPFYTLDFNDYVLEDLVKGGIPDPEDANAVQLGVEAKKMNIRQKMPLKVTINRDINEDIEGLRIEQILDVNGDIINKRFFNLQVQSMSEVDNFWLDSGMFSLGIN